MDTSSYAYDARGNRTTDSHNGLQISYNTLNLPSVVRKTDMTDSARFVYLADGTKLKTIDKDGHVVRYRGSLVIKQNSESGDESIAGALWDEGFTELSGSWWSGWTAKDVWYVKDYLGNVRGKYDLTNLTEISRSDYTPYGERLDASTTPLSTSYSSSWNDLHRRHFGGKEEVGDGGLNLLDFGARYYDPYSYSWTSVDPLARETSMMNTYSYANLNPINYIDPEGKRPIYSTSGLFLGVDEDGLQGEAHIMDEHYYHPGMEREEADKFDLGIEALDKEAKTIFYESYNSLKTRPDWDGYLTLYETNFWYRNGNGQPLFVSLDKINLSGVLSLGEKHVDDEKVIHLLLLGSFSLNDALVYGDIKLRRYPNNTVKAYSDTYDFKMQKSVKPFVLMRNLATKIGGKIAGKGQEYEIIIYGSKALKPILPWIK